MIIKIWVCAFVMCVGIFAGYIYGEIKNNED